MPSLVRTLIVRVSRSAGAARYRPSVGALLTLVNQFDVLATGRLDLPLIGKIVANYLIPFAVSNLGAMSGSDAEATRLAAGRGRRRCSRAAPPRAPPAIGVRRWLERHGVIVREVDVTASHAARDQLQWLTNAERPVPTLLLPDGRVVMWPGPATLEAIFGEKLRRSA